MSIDLEKKILELEKRVSLLEKESNLTKKSDSDSLFEPEVFEPIIKPEKTVLEKIFEEGDRDAQEFIDSLPDPSKRNTEAIFEVEEEVIGEEDEDFWN